MKKNPMKIILTILIVIILFSINNLNNFVFSEEKFNDGLTIANVRSFYRIDDKRLKIIFLLLNTSNKNITVLTEHLNTGFVKDKNKVTCTLDVGISMKYKGYKIIQSLYNFAPVTLKPNEGTFINHNVKKNLNTIDEKTNFSVKYKISEEFGKRFNVWHGSLEASPIKLKIKKKK